MTDKLKQNLRYYKASVRLLKTVYPEDKNMRKLCKLDELRDNISKYNDALWAEIYSLGYKPNIDNNNPQFYKHFDVINDNIKRINSIGKSIENLENKGYKLEAALEQKYLLNKGRASQSF